MSFLYLAGLLLSLSGMVLIDRRWKLFLWRDPRRGILVLVVGVVFLLAWDAAGVGLGVFFRGASPVLTGLQLAPEVPVEELFFLSLLCYLTMNLYGALSRALPGSPRPAGSPARPPAGSPARQKLRSEPPSSARAPKTSPEIPGADERGPSGFPQFSTAGGRADATDTAGGRADATDTAGDPTEPGGEPPGADGPSPTGARA